VKIIPEHRHLLPAPASLIAAALCLFGSAVAQTVTPLDGDQAERFQSTDGGTTWVTSPSGDDQLLAGDSSNNVSVFETGLSFRIDAMQSQIAEAESASLTVHFDQILGSGPLLEVRAIGSLIPVPSGSNLNVTTFRNAARAGELVGTVDASGLTPPSSVTFDVTALLKGIDEDYVIFLLTTPYSFAGNNANATADAVAFYREGNGHPADLAEQFQGGAYLTITPPEIVVPDYLDIHPLAPGDASYSQLSAKVDGVPVSVTDFYKSCYSHLSADPTRTIEIEITAAEPIESITVFPRRHGIVPEVDGNRATFQSTGQQYWFIRVNDYKQYFLMVSPLEESSPLPGDTDVVDLSDYDVDDTGIVTETAAIQQAIDDVHADPEKRYLYVPAGIYKSGSIRLKSGVVLHLSEGAVLQAADTQADFSRENPSGCYRRYVFIGAENATDCGIDGRGIIDGNGLYLRQQYNWPTPFTVQGRPGTVDANRVSNIVFSRCTDAFIRGVISRNPSSWNTVIYSCDGTIVADFKAVSTLQNLNEDAIDPDSVRRFSIRNSLFIAHDDGIVFKNCGTYQGQAISPDGGTRDNEDVLVIDNVVYSETAALKYGNNESEASHNRNFRFENNDVVSALWGVKIRTGGPGYVSDFTFISNWYDEVNETRSGLGSMNVRLFDGDSYELQFIDEVHHEMASRKSVCNSSEVTFTNVTIAGEPLQQGNDLFVVNGSNVYFDPHPKDIPYRLVHVTGSEDSLAPNQIAPRLTTVDGSLRCTFEHDPRSAGFLLEVQTTTELGTEADWQTSFWVTGEEYYEGGATLVSDEEIEPGGARRVVIEFSDPVPERLFVRLRAAVEE